MSNLNSPGCSNGAFGNIHVTEHCVIVDALAVTMIYLFNHLCKLAEYGWDLSALIRVFVTTDRGILKRVHVLHEDK